MVCPGGSDGNDLCPGERGDEPHPDIEGSLFVLSNQRDVI